MVPVRKKEDLRFNGQMDGVYYHLGCENTSKCRQEPNMAKKRPMTVTKIDRAPLKHYVKKEGRDLVFSQEAVANGLENTMCVCIFLIT